MSYVYHYTHPFDHRTTATLQLSYPSRVVEPRHQLLTSSCVLHKSWHDKCSRTRPPSPDFLTPFSFVRGSRGLLAACCLLGCQQVTQQGQPHTTHDSDAEVQSMGGRRLR